VLILLVSFHFSRPRCFRFLIIVAIEVAVYLYSASRAVLYKTVGEDGRGPWSKLEEVEGGDGGER